MNHFSSKWVVAKDYRGTAAGERFATLEKVFSCTGEEITDDPISQVLRVSVGDRRYYVKRYTAARKSISRFFGKSRICSEWENLLAFEKLGIPVPPIVAYGQKTRRGLFKCGALVTEEVPGAADLDRYVRKHRAILQDKAWVRAVIDQVADYTRVMHRAGFVHGNLNWRNILVTTSGEPRVFFIDCPAGGRKRGGALKRAVLKDIAFLDKLGRKYLKRTEQLRFFKRYRETERLSVQDKRDIAFITMSLDKHRERKRRRFMKEQQERLKAKDSQGV